MYSNIVTHESRNLRQAKLDAVMVTCNAEALTTPSLVRLYDINNKMSRKKLLDYIIKSR